MCMCSRLRRRSSIGTCVCKLDMWQHLTLCLLFCCAGNCQCVFFRRAWWAATCPDGRWFTKSYAQHPFSPKPSECYLAGFDWELAEDVTTCSRCAIECEDPARALRNTQSSSTTGATQPDIGMCALGRIWLQRRRVGRTGWQVWIPRIDKDLPSHFSSEIPPGRLRSALNLWYVSFRSC